ncbi:alpha/beta fold hydrolase [Tundrisphaera lichenicola]|uniref:alpha/beta fold hydrolase n=1 Tax=Tundrisphaera lichenicola TaxID=2029860 RepID=UPI003EBDFA39
MNLSHRSERSSEPNFRRISTNGITLQVAEAGPEDGPPVLLLHGFPEFWYGWRYQISALTKASYRVIVPDQRGFNLSDKPRSVADYRLENLVDDVIGLMDSMSFDRVSIIGHDWGGVVAWQSIQSNFERFDKAVILNAPHPQVMLRELSENPVQCLRSWYTFLFQIPYLPELILSSNDWKLLSREMERSSLPGTYSPEDFEAYKKSWREPRAITSMFHWYRAAFRDRATPLANPLIPIPTLILWGGKDKYLGKGLARSSFALCDNARLEWIEDATHWLHHEQPDRVNQLVLEFLRGSQPHTRGEATDLNQL